MLLLPTAHGKHISKYLGFGLELCVSGKDSKGKIPCDVGSNSIRRSFPQMFSDVVIDALANFQLHSSDFSD